MARRGEGTHVRTVRSETRLLTVFVALAGCELEPVIAGGECQGLLPGDLVITEVMANPTGSDRGREWFEVHNPGATPISLEGVRLVASSAEGTSEKAFVLTEGEVPSGAYFVFGDGSGETAFIDRSYGTKLGALRNTAGRLAIVCGNHILSELRYGATREGRSLYLSGDVAPEGLLEGALYCDTSEEEFESGNFGTPGRANEICPRVPPEGHCLDQGVERLAVPPRPGDLLLTEVLPDPQAVSDRDGEWFEVMVLRDVDLAGLEIGLGLDAIRTRFADGHCRPVKAGDRLVFARNDEVSQNGGLPQVDHLVSLTLPNAGGSLLLTHGGELIDSVQYGAARPGVAFARDPDGEAPDGVWCAAVLPYGQGDLGTPGERNPTCGLPRDDGRCRENGELRPIDPPGLGDILLSEIFVNSRAVADGAGEWIELRIERDLDLNGLELGTTFGASMTWQRIDGPDCLRARAGSLVVLARDPEADRNGGVENVDFVQGFLLRNADGRLIARHGEVLLDEFAWTSSRSGVALQRDARGRWCAATQPYGSPPADGMVDVRNLGSPGAPNESCGEVAPTPDDSTQLPEELPPGTCIEGESVRVIDPVGVDDLFISEVLANSRVVPDGAGEWIELRIARDVDLNGLTLGTAYGTGTAWQTLEDRRCLRVARGQFVLLGRNADATTNGGLPPIDFPIAFLLRNTQGFLVLAREGEVLDELRWSTTTAGTAMQRDAEGVFCAARTPYGDPPEEGGADLRNRGTPGGANEPCL